MLAILVEAHIHTVLFIQANYLILPFLSISKMFSSHELVFIFGILGNIVAFLVFLAPVPTFKKIWQKKSSEGFSSCPYVVALLSAMLLLYYGFLKTNAILIVTINGIGIVIEIIYLIMYLIYAQPRSLKIKTLLMILIADVGGFGVTLLVTLFAVKGVVRVQVVGWICAIFNILVFAAPLSVMRKVIRDKSVEFMPFPLSLCLTLTAIMWFFYGLFDEDLFIMAPNVLGFLFGIVQMILYFKYRKGSSRIEEAPSAELAQQKEWTSKVNNELDFAEMKEIPV